MSMHTLAAAAALYVTYILLSAAVIRAAVCKNRAPLTVLAATMPVIMVLALVQTAMDLVLRRRREAEPVSARLGEAERLVEERRAEVFGVPESDVWIADYLHAHYKL